MKHATLIIFLAFIGFLTVHGQDKNVQIDIHILGYDGTSEFQYFLSKDNNGNFPIKVQPDKNGKITIRKQIDGLRYFFFYYRNDGDDIHSHRCKMLVEPNKHYSIVSKGEDYVWPTPKGYTYSPDIYSWSIKSNDEYSILRMDFNQMYYNMFDDDTRGCLYADNWNLQQPDSLIDCLNYRISNRLSYYTDQYENGIINSEFYTIMKANIEYLLAYQLAQTIMCSQKMLRYRIEDETITTRLWEVYDSIFTLYPVGDDNLRYVNCSQDYVQVYLYLYASKKRGDGSGKIREYSHYIDEIKPMLNEQVYKNYNMGRVAGMVGSLVLDSSEEAKKFLEENEDMKETQWGVFLEDELIPRLNRFDSLANRPPSDEIIYLDTERTINSYQELIDMFKGKPFLIDFWGTWCGGCRNMFKFKATLDSFLVQNGIEMVYAAYEYSNDRENWQKIIRAYDLNGYHFMLSDSLKSDIETRSGKLRGYPTYMIVNEQGDIVENHAYLPSDGNMLQEQIKLKLNK